MAKGKGKKSKRKGKMIGHSNAKMKKVKVPPKVSPSEATVPAAPTPLTDATVSNVCDPEINSNGGAARSEEEENQKGIYGFIFMCNSNTKLECYQYHVFGLPSGKKEAVEQIKPGAKLFLFDFELKLLYGVYEATSAGKLNLEPAAFKGRFNAQVKFKIFKECLPLPEGLLRSVIVENYTGNKFKQDLSEKQVKKLISAFHPLTSLSQTATQTLPNAPISRTILPAMENQSHYTGIVPALERPHLAAMQYSCIPPLQESQPVTNMYSLQQVYHGTAAYPGHVNQMMNHQSFPAPCSYATHYSRYPRMKETAHAGQYHRIPLQGDVMYEGNANVHNPNAEAADRYTPSRPQFSITAAHHIPAHLQFPTSTAAYTLSQPQFSTATLGDNKCLHLDCIKGMILHLTITHIPCQIPGAIDFCCAQYELGGI